MIGSVFEGRYAVNGFLSEGPIFILHSARDRLTSKDISLRLLKAPFDTEENFKSALGEAITRTSAIQSQFVERLFDLSSDSGKSYVLGELTRAPSLSDRIRKLAPFTASVSIASIISVTRGLDAYHKHGISHGDVSGDNIAILGDGETRLQLGGVWEAYSSSATAGIMVLPSLAPYLAPEISNGAFPSISSDLYAVGILLFELLTGKKPYLGETGLATALRHSTEPTPRARYQNPSIPAVIDEMVYKAMSKDEASRYASAGEFLFDLRQAQDALRFGRSLSWPLKSATPVQEPPKKVMVAPKMSAARAPEPAPENRSKERRERDVPVWMLLLFAAAFSAMGALLLAGFFIGANRPHMVLVPNLAGLTLSEAEAVLQPMHLKVRLGSPVPSSKLEANRIVTSSPAAKEKVAENSVVSLNMSMGARMVAVPQLKGLTPDKAREVLGTVNLELDDQISHLNTSGVPVGAICKQIPPAGSKLQRTGKVHVAVYDPGQSGAAEPATGSYSYSVNVKLTDLTEPTEVRIDISDAGGVRTLYKEQKNPGETIDLSAHSSDSSATFMIYYADRLVAQKQVDSESSP